MFPGKGLSKVGLNGKNEIGFGKHSYVHFYRNLKFIKNIYKNILSLGNIILKIQTKFKENQIILKNHY